MASKRVNVREFLFNELKTIHDEPEMAITLLLKEQSEYKELQKRVTLSDEQLTKLKFFQQVGLLPTDNKAVSDALVEFFVKENKETLKAKLDDYLDSASS